MGVLHCSTALAASPYAPALPGITTEDRRDERVPALITALGEPDEDGKRAQALDLVAREWFEVAAWYHRESVECTANYFGAQYGFWSDPEARFITVPEPRRQDEVRVVVNILKPVVDQAVGILTQEPPVFKPRAATTEGEDSAVQQAAADFIAYLWRHNDLDALYRLSGRGSVNTGTAYILPVWDETEGPISEAADPVGVGPDGPVAQSAKKIGDLRYTYLDNSQVAYEPGCRRERDSSAVVIRERYRLSVARKKFDLEDAALTDGADRADTSFDLDAARRANRVSPVDGSWSQEESSLSDDEILVYTFFVGSCPEYPRGLQISVGGGKVLYEGPNPRFPAPGEPDVLWPATKWPVFKIVCDPRENSPYGRGRLLDQIEVQRSFNGTVSKSLEHMAKVANAKVYMPKGLDVEWTDQVGQVIRLPRTMQSGQIGYLSPSDLPPTYFHMWDRLREVIEYGIGVNASTMGASATNVESGRHANMLMQRDYGRLDPVKRALDTVWADIMRYSLQLFRRHADQQRKVLIAGENHQTSIQFFDQAAFASPVDVIVENNQSIPRDPTQRSTFLTQLAQNLALIEDPTKQAMFLELYRLHDFEPFLERMNPDQVKARRMCQRILLGQPTPVFPGDDPLVFKAELERLAKSEEYEGRVASEGGEQTSPTAQLLMALWLHYTQSAAGPATEPGPATPQSPGAATPPAEPQTGAPATEPVTAAAA